MSNYGNNRRIKEDQHQHEGRPIIAIAIGCAVLAIITVLVVIILIKRTKDSDVNADNQPQTVLENSCEHLIWDSYNTFGHQCRACGIKNEHVWVSEDGIKYCKLCYEIEDDGETD